MSKRRVVAMCIVPLLGLIFGCANDEHATNRPLTVDHVEPDRFAGKWYEISHMPQLFETDCMAGTIEFTPGADGTFKVVSICHKQTYEGRTVIREGTARIVDTTSNAKLQGHLGRGEGEEWIIGLD